MYRRIYAVVRLIPCGRVATYGHVARLAGSCGPRNVGYAMSSVPVGSDIPWHRVMNAQGRISVRSDGEECSAQRQLLEAEGVSFSPSGRVNLDEFGWEGPEWVEYP
jgi:methylated-DNA-protein-cysteine methyltransferase related protein